VNGKGKKICLVSAGGGHFAELRALRPAYERYDYFYVLNEGCIVAEDMRGKRIYFILHAERDWRNLWNFFEAWRILRKERPDLILSTGSAPAIPFFVLGKLAKIPTVFVEISAHVVAPSLSGRILYRLADRFFFQWPSMARCCPKGICGGLIL
jgi:UDP-N-acetylglucosamine:LPS N-acetylglucosamine transferase